MLNYHITSITLFSLLESATNANAMSNICTIEDATPDHTSSTLIVSDLLCTSSAGSSAMINPLGGDSSICSLEKEQLAAEQHKEHHQKQLKVGNPNNNN